MIDFKRVYRVGFTGTQIGMTEKQKEKAMFLFGVLQMREFHHGDCIGADADAHRMMLLMHRGRWVIIHPPLNPSKRAFCKEGKILPEKDYIPRNHDIVDSTDVLIATPKTMEEELRSGTWATVRYARRRNKDVLIIYPDGSLVMKWGLKI